jgi:putative transposase
MTINTKKVNWNKGRSIVYKNTVHLVFITKYRNNVFTNLLLSVIEEVIRETCEQMGSELLEFNGENNHVHMIISANPKTALSNLVGKLKGKSSYILRRDHFDKIQKYLWGKHFWSPSYCLVSTGGTSVDIVRKYIENQTRPE